MLSIRLTRGGSKKKPVYDIVVAEKSFPRDGRYVETLGYSSPLQAAGDAKLRINLERYEYWFGMGAVPTDTVKRLVRDYRRTAGAQAGAQANVAAGQATKPKPKVKAESKAQPKAAKPAAKKDSKPAAKKKADKAAKPAAKKPAKKPAAK